MVDKAATELDQDRYLTLLRSAPPQLQAAMAAVIGATQKVKGGAIGTGEAYDAYKAFCKRAGLRALTGRAFGDLISELRHVFTASQPCTFQGQIWQNA
jgi:Cdc6-like AAA superfamily ATPase